MKNSTKTNAYCAAVLYALIIGLSFLFTKMALTVADPLNILAHRFTISFFTVLIPVLFGWIKLNISVRDVLSILPLSMFYPALFFAFQAFGLVYVSSSEAGIIQATIPVFTMILEL
jgi:drug/metabolite transporter (DMT)-like permease